MPTDLTPVSLLTGYLGSGKTTVLNYLLRQPSLARSVVIINEFGDIGLDHELVEASTESMVLLQSGCLCCTIRGDLIDTLHDLLNRRDRGAIEPFDRIIIETTGLADPAPIIHTLITDGLIGQELRLDGVIATIDAATGSATLDAQPEAVKQAAMADRILLTKTDLAGPHALREIEMRLRALNSGAVPIRTYQGVVEPSQILNVGLYDCCNKIEDVQVWLNAEAYRQLGREHNDSRHHHHNVNRHDDRISAVSYIINDPIPSSTFDLWLQTMMMLSGPRILRLKGIIHVECIPTPFVLNGVQHIFHPPILLDNWPSDDRRTRIVLIGHDLTEQFLQDSFAFLGSVTRKAHNNNSINKSTGRNDRCGRDYGDLTA
ncbi:GTP-binding protein [Ochrobactrum sp. S46]|nr:GTP-binding protein [Ochrobactrum sp. S45]MBK0046402.1 GTP-binding protein [Ochrobactrum sp. S46]